MVNGRAVSQQKQGMETAQLVTILRFSDRGYKPEPFD
jgi:hypothetical protein